MGIEVALGASSENDAARASGFSRPLTPRGSITGEVARRVLSMLANGDLRAGDKLPSERTLVADLRASRSSIRAALAMLDVLGFVETRPGAGTFVKDLASDVLPQSVEWGLLIGRPRTLELVEARGQIEVVIAQLAASRASEDDLDAVRAAFARMDRASEEPDAFVDADVDFHLAIAALAGNSVLADLLRSIRSLLEVWIRRASHDHDERSAALEEHRRVLDAIATGDAELARAAMQHHMASARARLSASLDT